MPFTESDQKVHISIDREPECAGCGDALTSSIYVVAAQVYCVSCGKEAEEEVE